MGNAELGIPGWNEGRENGVKVRRGKGVRVFYVGMRDGYDSVLGWIE